MLESLFIQFDIAHWLSILEAAGVPCGSINSIDQVMDNPQVKAREMVIQVAHPTAGNIHMVASPLKIPTIPAREALPPPLLGEHTEQILQDLLGLDHEAVQALRAEQVI
jgi:crotonobetainyl-CoA:carnitine CoA-transferase CaiB-like acyl-CoA transferase